MAEVRVGPYPEGVDLSQIIAELSAKEREALEVIKGDLCQWLGKTLATDITPPTFLECLEDGVEVCRLAGAVQKAARVSGSSVSSKVPMDPLSCNLKPGWGTFSARDNTSNFISWCRGLGVEEAVIFESEGLVLHKDEKRVILCLLDVARFAERVGIPPPQLVHMEREIESLELESKSIKATGRGNDNHPHADKVPNDKISQFEKTIYPLKQEEEEVGGASPVGGDVQVGGATQRTPPTTRNYRSYLPTPIKPTHPPLPTTAPLRRTSQRIRAKKDMKSLIPVRTGSTRTPVVSRRKRIGTSDLEEETRTPVVSHHKRTRGSDPEEIRMVVKRSRGSDLEKEIRAPVVSRHKRARASDLEEDDIQSSSKRLKKDREGEGVNKRRKGGREQAESKEDLMESVGDKVMRKMEECTCKNRIEVTNCGNGKFIVKGASGRKMTIYARVSE